MTGHTSQWLVSGHTILDDHNSLWAFCEAQSHLLGSGATAIAENGLKVAIDLWTNFDCATPWTQGRLFGPKGEIQWRTFGSLVRMVMLLDVQSETGAIEAADRLQRAGLAATVQLAMVLTRELALQTNDDEFPAVRVYQYGNDREPAQFVRYGEVLPGLG